MGKIIVVCSEFNKKLVEQLYKQAGEEFAKHYCDHHSTEKPWELKYYWVPGAGEIPVTVKWLTDQQIKDLKGILALGVIIRGQTTHYDFLCQFLERSLWDLQNKAAFPILYSILMTENKEQAKQRIERNRGSEGMKSLCKMIEINSDIKNTP